jgi:hypothetical protein
VRRVVVGRQDEVQRLAGPDDIGVAAVDAVQSTVRVLMPSA